MMLLDSMELKLSESRKYLEVLSFEMNSIFSEQLLKVVQMLKFILQIILKGQINYWNFKKDFICPKWILKPKLSMNLCSN